MEAFLVSTLAITLGEMGDKTQLLALLLAARFKRPIPIVLGILVATTANHLIAAVVGAWVASEVPAEVLRWLLGLSFLAIAAWTLKPDNLEDSRLNVGHYGVFLVTVITFFLAEIGDKTQIATVVLAAEYKNIAMVVAGTTLGMLIADVPAVYLGKIASPKLPIKWIRLTAAFIFAGLGVAVLMGLGV